MSQDEILYIVLMHSLDQETGVQRYVIFNSEESSDRHSVFYSKVVHYKVEIRE